MRWKANRCPLCSREFQVTPSDDVLIPACGCYDAAPEGEYPCEDCGIAHVYACQGMGEPPTRRVVVFVEPA